MATRWPTAVRACPGTRLGDSADGVVVCQEKQGAPWNEGFDDGIDTGVGEDHVPSEDQLRLGG